MPYTYRYKILTPHVLMLSDNSYYVKSKVHFVHIDHIGTKVMCNGNELHFQSNGNGNDYFSEMCVMVMVMVMKKMQCNGNVIHYFQK